MIFAEFDNTSQVSNKRHELLTHREHMCSPPVYLLVESVFLIFLVFYGVLCFFVIVVMFVVGLCLVYQLFVWIVNS